MQTQCALTDLNDDVLHVLCEHLLEAGDGKAGLVGLSCTSKRLNEICRRYLFREITLIQQPASIAELRKLYEGLARMPIVRETLRHLHVSLWSTEDSTSLDYTATLSFVFLLLRVATRVTVLELCGPRLRYHLVDDGAEHDPNMDDIRNAQMSSGITTLPAVIDLKAPFHFGSFLLPLCPKLEELELYNCCIHSTLLNNLSAMPVSPLVRNLTVDPATATRSALKAISTVLPSLTHLEFSSETSQLLPLEEVSLLVQRLPDLEHLTVPNIINCGIDDFSLVGTLSYATPRPCMEVVAMKLFKAGERLQTVKFLATDFLGDENELEDAGCVLGVLRKAAGDIEELCWLHWPAKARWGLNPYKIASRGSVEESIRRWLKAFAQEGAVEYLNLYGAV